MRFRMIFLLFSISISMAMVTAMIENDEYIEGFPTDLPDSPMEGITRNTSSITISPNVTATVVMPNNPVCGGTNFTITVTITNTNGAPTAYNILTVLSMIPNNPNVIFVSAVASVGVFADAGTSVCPNAGIGTWTIGAPVPAGTTFTLTITCSAAAVGATVNINNGTQVNTTIPSSQCIANTMSIAPSPVANNFSGSVCNNSPALNGTLTESSGTPPFIFAITTPTPPSQGTIAIVDPNAGTFQFVPNRSFSGTASFLFNVTDFNNCTSNTAMGNITVFPSPTSGPFSTTTCSASVLVIDVAPLVSGGTPPYTFGVAGGVSGGTVTVNPVTGVYTFTKFPGFVGAGGFIYSATDTNGCVTTNTVTIIFATEVFNTYVTAYQAVFFGQPCS